MSQRLFPVAHLSFVLTMALTAATAQAQQTPQAQQPPTATSTATQSATQSATAVVTPPHVSSGLPVDTASLTCTDLPKLITAVDKVKTKMDDWPQLQRYATANGTVTAPAPGETRVVFLGDSITDNWQNPKFGGFFPGKPYVDRGISGQTTPQMVLRMRPDVIALKPKAMLLLAGTNDIAGNTGPMTITRIEDNIATIAELATLHDIKVILASVLPTSNYHFKNNDPRGPQTQRRPLESIRAINTWMKQYATEHGHVYLDYYTAMIDSAGMLKTEFSEDDLHPTAAGYAVMAPLAEAAITKALSTSATTPTNGVSK
jgi:lysophospholipase L1-like esterase